MQESATLWVKILFFYIAIRHQATLRFIDLIQYLWARLEINTYYELINTTRYLFMLLVIRALLY